MSVPYLDGCDELMLIRHKDGPLVIKVKSLRSHSELLDCSWKQICHSNIISPNL
jgi:hypothetical protein